MAPLLISSPWNPLASEGHVVLQQKTLQIGSGQAGNYFREARGTHNPKYWHNSTARQIGHQNDLAENRKFRLQVVHPAEAMAPLLPENQMGLISTESGPGWPRIEKFSLCHEWPGAEQCNNGDLPGQARISFTTCASCTPVALCASPRNGKVRRLWLIPSW